MRCMHVVVRADVAANHQIGDDVVAAEAVGDREVDRVLVPEGGELHVPIYGRGQMHALREMAGDGARRR